jgi:hypothetical protein
MIRFPSFRVVLVDAADSLIDFRYFWHGKGLLHSSRVDMRPKFSQLVRLLYKAPPIATLQQTALIALQGELTLQTFILC